MLKISKSFYTKITRFWNFDIKKRKNKETHLAFIDLRFSTKNKTMEDIKKPSSLITMVKNLYKENRVCAKIGNKFSNAFGTTRGLLHGCSTSPTPFKIFLYKTLGPWKRKCKRMDVAVGNNHLYNIYWTCGRAGSHGPRREWLQLYCNETGNRICETWTRNELQENRIPCDNKRRSKILGVGTGSVNKRHGEF